MSETWFRSSDFRLTENRRKRQKDRLSHKTRTQLTHTRIPNFSWSRSSWLCLQTVCAYMKCVCGSPVSLDQWKSWHTHAFHVSTQFGGTATTPSLKRSSECSCVCPLCTHFTSAKWPRFPSSSNSFFYALDYINGPFTMFPHCWPISPSPLGHRPKPVIAIPAHPATLQPTVRLYCTQTGGRFTE
jgi:hypothetical protein